VAVIRVSGPEAQSVLQGLAGATPPARCASLRWLCDPEDGRAIDHGLTLWFPGPGSFTGEDVAEFQIHGGPATVAALVRAISRWEGCRAAEPGEFTRRAFLNGKLDLTEVESLADLIAAETEAQRTLALRGVAGEARRLYEGWRGRLVAIMARVEATIDFADEDIPDDLIAKALVDVSALEREMRDHLADDGVGERLRDGFTVTIIGAPNAGKSSLLNRLAAREAAIVTSQPGATRDPIEAHLNLGGYPLTLIDTAGLRESDDPIEQEGMRRARERAAGADLKLLLMDGDPPPEVRAEMTGAYLLVANKIDVTPAPSGMLGVSAMTGEGMTGLVTELTRRAAERLSVGASLPVLRARHRESVESARVSLGRALAAASPDLLAEDLRLAARAIGAITGRVDVDDWLDLIFREFCIGK
jgi:tRNA modification GTPase